MKKAQRHQAYPTGKEIVTFTRGSWQESEHARGRRFYDSIAYADRLVRAADSQPAVLAGELSIASVIERPPLEPVANLTAEV